MSMIGINGRYGTQAQENTVTAQNSQSDYAKALQTKYDYLNAATNMNGVPTTVTVSSAFVAKCAKDPEKAAYLEENLVAIPDCVASAKTNCLGTITNISYHIDGNGNISCMMSGTNDPDGKIARENAEKKAKEQQEAKKKAAKHRGSRLAAKGRSVRDVTNELIKKISRLKSERAVNKFNSQDTLEISEEGRLALEQEKAAQENAAPGDEDSDEISESQGGKVGINAGKLARMLAAAKTRSQVQAVVAKIQADLNECDAGKEQGMDVDEASIQAAELLLQQAKSRMGSAENREATPEEELASALAGLM